MNRQFPAISHFRVVQLRLVGHLWQFDDGGPLAVFKMEYVDRSGERNVGHAG